MSEFSLDELRTKIDSIDDQIHDLIMERAKVVAHVAAAKGIENKQLPIRPAREADMLRRLKKRHEGAFPFASVARMWQEMIAAFTQIQNSYSIAVFVNEQQQANWDIARDQFGAQTPLTAHGAVRETLSQVFDGKAAVAVLPKPAENSPDDWWITLCRNNAPKIIGKLPFAGHGSLRGSPQEVYAVADIPLAPTGDDFTFLVVESKKQVSRDMLTENLNNSGLSNYQIQLSTSSDDDGWLHLIEIHDFLTEEDEAIIALSNQDIIAHTHIIGHYPNAVL